MTVRERMLSAAPWARKREETPREAEARAQTPDELVERFSGEVWRFVSSQIDRREDVEDVVMEVFAAAFTQFVQVRRAADQRLWLLAIARRKVADMWRRRYRRSEQSLDDLERSMEDADLNVSQIATRTALARLSESEREALILKYVNGLSTEEVAQVLRRSAPATNSLLQRARERMREALGARLVETI